MTGDGPNDVARRRHGASGSPGAAESRGASGIRSQTVANHLKRLGVPPERQQSYLHPRLAELSAPDAMADREAVAGRLARAIVQNEEVIVFGDYDCDGMTAAAILFEVITELGGQATAQLASRFAGGYGVSDQAVDRILAERPKLLVTCDCGSSDHDSLARVRRAGVDVVVIDHHLVPDKPLPAVGFLNPHRPDCGFPFKGLASCGLVLSVAAALRKQLAKPLDLRKWLDLVAIGSIADVAPLTSDNRALVRAGLARLRQAERPGLRALCDLIGVDRDYPLTADDVAFRIAPRLNAPGRMGAPDLAFRLLVEKNHARARELAEKVEDSCQQRRDQQGHIVEAVDAELAARGSEHAAIVVGRPGWNHGIVGIVAGRVAELHQKPTVVVGFDGDVGRGSVRGPAGFPLFDALSECSDHLLRFGGHQAAAGVTLRWSCFEAFREAFDKACAERTDYERPAPPEPLDFVAGDDLRQVLEDLYLLEPCGEGNPAPELRLRADVISSRCVKGDHLKLELQMGPRTRLGGFGPTLGRRFAELSGSITVIGRLRPDRFRGNGAVEMLVRQVLSEAP